MGDPGLIPGLGRSPREGNGNPLQYSCPPKEKGLKEIFRLDSVVAQMVKHLPTMQETRVQSLGQKDSLEKGKTTHYSILAWGISWTEKAMAPHSSTLAWKIIWMEEPGKLQSMGSLRVRHG